MTTYTQYIFHNDILISKFKAKGDSLEDMFNIHCKPMLLNTMKRHNISLHKQIDTYEEYCNTIEKQKFNCYKIKASELLLYNTCYCSLVKFGKRDPQDCIFLKNKKKLRIVNR
tara:strand:+ start:1125 stop:1463 length:339 start_codon:yes stop_codon:yes gene_type:complete